MRHCRANCTPGAVLQHKPLTPTYLESLITDCLKSDNADLGNLGTLLSVPCSHTHHKRQQSLKGAQIFIHKAAFLKRKAVCTVLMLNWVQYHRLKSHSSGAVVKADVLVEFVVIDLYGLFLRDPVTSASRNALFLAD